MLMPGEDDLAGYTNRAPDHNRQRRGDRYDPGRDHADRDERGPIGALGCETAEKADQASAGGAADGGAHHPAETRAGNLPQIRCQGANADKDQPNTGKDFGQRQHRGVITQANMVRIER
jgi:hypothetical protein